MVTGHAGLVALLIWIREWGGIVGASQLAASWLRWMDFWVYRWVLELFNREWFGRPFLKVSLFLGLSSMKQIVACWEFLFLSLFGGIVYGLIAVWIFGWTSPRARNHPTPAAA